MKHFEKVEMSDSVRAEVFKKIPHLDSKKEEVKVIYDLVLLQVLENYLFNYEMGSEEKVKNMHEAMMEIKSEYAERFLYDER